MRVGNPIRVPLAALRIYFRGQGTFHVGEKNEALQALNVAFRHGPALLFESTRTSFYPPPASSAQRDASLVLSPNFLQLIRALLNPV